MLKNEKLLKNLGYICIGWIILEFLGLLLNLGLFQTQWTEVNFFVICILFVKYISLIVAIFGFFKQRLWAYFFLVIAIVCPLFGMQIGIFLMDAFLFLTSWV